MTNINLLPWREQLREERKKAFLGTVVLIVLAAGALLLLADRLVNSEIERQVSRNNFLSERIAELDRDLVEIRELRSQKAALTERMAVIQDLQGSRPVIVRLFDELVRSLPEGVWYQRISRSGDVLRLEGYAGSNALVSELMRRLDDSEWLARPNLQQVVADNERGAELSRNRFLLTVNITRPEPEEQE